MFGRIKERWDSICTGCGQCCCDKLKIKKLRKRKRKIPGVTCINRRYAIDYTSPCCYLDIETGSCSIYNARFKTCNNCLPMTIFHAMLAGYLPADCAYVKKFRFWRRNLAG